MTRHFLERRDPMESFVTEKAFRQRYRLSKGIVEQLAEEFGQSQWATKGTRSSKGLSHVERVSMT